MTLYYDARYNNVFEYEEDPYTYDDSIIILVYDIKNKPTKLNRYDLENILEMIYSINIERIFNEES
jgi:hypothetical protein